MNEFMDMHDLESRKQIIAQSGFPFSRFPIVTSAFQLFPIEREEQKVFPQYNRRNVRKLYRISNNNAKISQEGKILKDFNDKR